MSPCESPRCSRCARMVVTVFIRVPVPSLPAVYYCANWRVDLKVNTRSPDAQAENQAMFTLWLSPAQCQSSEIFHQVGEPIDRIVVVGCAGRESHLDIQSMSRRHGFRDGVEVNRLAPGSRGTIEHRLCERSPQAES